MAHRSGLVLLQRALRWCGWSVARTGSLPLPDAV